MFVMSAETGISIVIWQRAIICNVEMSLTSAQKVLAVMVGNTPSNSVYDC